MTRDRRNGWLRRPEGVELAITVALLFALIVGGLSLSFLALLDQMSVAACSGDPAACNDLLLGWAFYLTPGTAAASVLATLAGLLFGFPWVLPAWWIPTLGIGVTLSAFVVSLLLVEAAIP